MHAGQKSGSFYARTRIAGEEIKGKMSKETRLKGGNEVGGRKIPDVVVRRLPLYLRVLEELDVEETPIISSHELGEQSGVTPGQLRKDLSFFGVFGKQGVGYNTLYLREELRRILKLDQQVNVGLVGVGNLGMALIHYHKPKEDPNGTGLRLVAAFDVDPQKIGKRISDVPIYSVEKLPEVIRQLEISIIILAVPAEVTEDIFRRCVESGVRAFLNFAPGKLSAPAHVRIHTTDVTLELESLAYYR